MFAMRSVVFLSFVLFTFVANTGSRADEWKSGIEWKVPRVVDPGPVGGPPADATVLFEIGRAHV